MLAKWQADLDLDAAMVVVNETSKNLREKMILDPPPNASVVLNSLRDHHCLIEAPSNQPSYRFQHQLIQDWYGSNEVRRVALRALLGGDSRRILDERILNNREWTEAVTFAVEAFNKTDNEVDAISHLILRAMGIDADFAAALIAASPDVVWKKIAPAIRKFLDFWIQDCPKRTVQFVIQCGKADFSDIIWNAVNTEDSGSVYKSLNSRFFPHPSVLGPNWRQKLSGLDSEMRAGLLSMLVSSRRLDGALMALKAAIDDSNARVQREVADKLYVFGFEEELRSLLEKITPETWDELVRNQVIEIIWEEPWKETAIEAAQRVFPQLIPGQQRIRFCPQGPGIRFGIRFGHGFRAFGNRLSESPQ